MSHHGPRAEPRSYIEEQGSGEHRLGRLIERLVALVLGRSSFCAFRMLSFFRAIQPDISLVALFFWCVASSQVNTPAPYPLMCFAMTVFT